MKKAERTEKGKPIAWRQSWLQRLRRAGVPLTVCGLAFLVYARSLFCGFVRDDIAQIVHNRQVQSWQYLPQLVGSHLWSQVTTEDSNIMFYRPIFSVWMLLVHTIGGLAPWFWHLSNIVLHAVMTYLVFRFCRRLTKSDVGAALAAAVFAVHPIHVDAVTWVSASCEILFAICAMAAILALVDGENASPRVWPSALWFGAGLFAKETGVAMLAVLPALAWAQLKDSGEGRKRFWACAYPYGAVTAGYLLIRWAVMHRVGVERGEHSWAEVICSGPSIFLFYMKKLFLPWNLSGCYMNLLTSSSTTVFWLQLTALLTGLCALAWLAIRHNPLVGLSVALIAIPILPALAVIRVYPQGDMVHDRYLYLSSAGLSLLVAMLVKEVWPLQKAVKVGALTVVIALCVALAVETIYQQRYYQDDIAFYSRVLKLAPSDAYARCMLGNIYLDEGRNDLALEEFQRAHRFAPDNQKVTLFLARGLFVAGNFHEAETVLNELLQTPHLNARRRQATLLSLANVQISMGNLDYAQRLLQQVQQSDDRFPELHWAFGVLYQKQGLLAQALAEYEKEVEITGDELAQQRSATVARLVYSQSAGHPYR